MYFPFMIDLTGKRVVIIGGGIIALRKCELFLSFGADVTVVSPELCAGFNCPKQSYRYVCDIFREEYLVGAYVVVAATDNTSINTSISLWCKKHGILINVVDVPELCTFYVPAIVQQGDLTIGISTAGKSPALAGAIRRELSVKYDEEYSRRLQLLGELRELVKEIIDDPCERRSILIAATDLGVDALFLQVKEFQTRKRR